MRSVLGISAHHYDASAALIADGRVVAAAAEERFTRQKHDPSFPRFAIEFCLQEAGLAAQELDHIVFYERPHTKFTRVLSSALAAYPFSRSAFVGSMKAWIGSQLWIKNEISKKLDVHPNKIEFIPHQLSHAAQAFIGSSFKEAAILTIDTAGEWESTTLYWGRCDGALELKPLKVIPYPHSLSLVYAVFTRFLGFPPQDGDGYTMALSAFGRPTYADKIRKIIRLQADGTYRIDPSYFRLDQSEDIPYSKKFIDTFGAPRDYRQELPFDARLPLGNDGLQISKDHRRYADIAASIQLVLEETLLHLIHKLHTMTGSQNLCLAGRVALNCAANRRILKQSPFARLFIPPDPGDGGAALGAALYAYFTRSAVSAATCVLTPFMGKQYEAARAAEMLKHVNPDDWIPYRQSGCPPTRDTRLDVNMYDDFDQLIPGVVDDLEQGKIVGWFQGRFENGPRALGNRSLLLDPKNSKAVKRLSETIKSRAPFWPYAFSVTQEEAGKVLALDHGLAHTAKWMQTMEQVQTDRTDAVCAAMRSDGMTRPQVCAQEDNPRYHQLLSAFGAASGVSALLNTSLRESGYPMVASPAEALLVFARTTIDTMVINNLVVRRVKQ